MPMTVSWATPIASGSSREGGAGDVPGRAVADGSVIMLLYTVYRAAACRSGPRRLGSAKQPPADHNDHFRLLATIFIREKLRLGGLQCSLQTVAAGDGPGARLCGSGAAWTRLHLACERKAAGVRRSRPRPVPVPLPGKRHRQGRIRSGGRGISRPLRPAALGPPVRLSPAPAARPGHRTARLARHRRPGSPVASQPGLGVPPGRRGQVVGPEGNELVHAELVRRDVAAQRPARRQRPHPDQDGGEDVVALRVGVRPATGGTGRRAAAGAVRFAVRHIGTPLMLETLARPWRPGGMPAARACAGRGWRRPGAAQATMTISSRTAPANAVPAARAAPARSAGKLPSMR